MKEKKKNHQNPDSRRKFLGKSIFLGAGLVTGSSDFLQSQSKVKMLTPDGKLVEVDPALIKDKTGKTKNRDILNWMDQESIANNLKNNKNK